MKTSKLFLSISVIVFVTMFAGFVLPAGAADNNPSDHPLQGTNAKIIVSGLLSGEVVTVVNSNSGGPGVLAVSGGSIETFAPVGVSSFVYVWNPTKGSSLIGIVMPGATEPDIILDAHGAQVQQYAQLMNSDSGFLNRGLASPLNGAQSNLVITGGGANNATSSTALNCPNGPDSAVGRDHCRRDANGQKLDQ